ncbi:MAG: ATP-dependent RecD-like DNA helicase, partial [Lentisphaerae bacterium]|nr:ATP-dependent RecD-like DNA helicase [Lentisphaerota bacterium]
EPHSSAGIQKFLASGLIKGIGAVLAARLVKKFGPDTLRIIEKESARLETVPGIGHVRREQIKAAWNEQRHVRDIMIFLHAHGMGTAQATRIHRAYSAEAIAKVRENPYRLASEIWGIGFKTADKIAQTLHIPRDSLIRARAGLIHTLQTMTDEGHCYAPRATLLGSTAELLEIPLEILAQALDSELQTRTLIQEEEAVYLAALYQAEVGIAKHLRRLLAAATQPRILQSAQAIAWAGQQMRITFAPRQAEALAMALSHQLSIITGGPGVGKTTIIRAIADIFAAKQLTIHLAAPTGRAAKRMEEATRRAAKTLHRLLKYNPRTGQFEHHAGHPLRGDVFILDEISMIDAVLMHAFLQALPTDATLILVGDADQLPSVGPGNVLRDCLASGAIPTLKLDTIFRQKGRSWIVHNAHRINAGLSLELPAPEETSDFYFIEEKDPQRVVEQAVELVTRRIPERFGLNPKTEIQLLTPMRRFTLGSENMNAVLQAVLNPEGPALSRWGRLFRAGDRVMQLRNNYDKDIYNGDIGWIRTIAPEEQQISVDFDGREVLYDLAEIDELSLAYACSIHKAQGNEHPAVVILLTTQHYKLLQRNLLYTALTRGRRLVCLIGSRKAVQIAIRNNHVLQRRTQLKELLQLKLAAGETL